MVAVPDNDQRDAPQPNYAAYDRVKLGHSETIKERKEHSPVYANKPAVVLRPR